MDDIGVSLFQAADNIQFNSNNDQHEEEEEDKEDLKRRDEQIKDGLEGAFDDISDCESINSSHYKDSTHFSEANVSVNSSSSKFHSAQKHRTPMLNNYEPHIPNLAKDTLHNTHKSLYNNYKKPNHGLKHSFEQEGKDQICTTPSSRFSDQLNMYTNNGHIDGYDIYRTHSNLEEVEKEEQINNLELMKMELQMSLDKAKEEIVYLQSEVKTLRDGNESQHNTIKSLSEDLAVSRTVVNDLQNKIAILESTQSMQANHDKKLLKQAQEKYAMELKNLQNQTDHLTSELRSKEAAYALLESKFEDLRTAHNVNLIENSEKMNRLTRALQESQKQCENLMTAKTGFGNVQLQTQLDVAVKEKEELLKKIEDLEHKLIAHNDEMQYFSLLRHAGDDESDSIQQMRLGSAKTKSNLDDLVNQLRGELQRSLEGQSMKRKEIVRLEALLDQKQQQLDEALVNVNEQTKRAGQLEAELKSLLSDQAKKADTKIKKLSDHLNDVRKQNETLKREKQIVEEKLEETLSINHELSSKLYQTTINDEEIPSTVLNKEYLELHEKAVQKVKEEAEMKQMQLEVQLEQTQKSLDHVKQSYIDVCASKEQLVNEYKQEMKTLKEKYENFEMQEQALEKCEQELSKQSRLVEKLSNDCDKYRNKMIELEKDLELERRKKTQHMKLIHNEIERAKEAALKELRNAHPNHEINVRLPDYCSKHMDKITELENDCKRLEEKLSAAMEDQRKLSDLQVELDSLRLNLAQTEIGQEAWIKKYETLQKEMSKMQSKYEEVLSDNENRREKMAKLEQELVEARTLIESSLKAHASGDRSDFEDETSSRLKQLEKDVQMRDEKLKEMEKIKDERDDLVSKLKNQAKQFKQFLKNQRQVSVELSADDTPEMQKIKETVIKEVREEWEQKVKDKLKQIEDNHQVTLNGLKRDCEEKSREVETLKESMQAEKAQLHASFKMQEQKIVQNIQTRIGEQLLSRKLKIKELEDTVKQKNDSLKQVDEMLKQREKDIEQERNVMAQLLSNWSAELNIIQNRERELKEELSKVKSSEEVLAAEVKLLKDKKLETDGTLKAVKKKYHCVKKIAFNYKEHAEKKDKRFRNECKRIEESYKKSVSQVQLKIDTLISLQDKEMAKKLRDLEVGYTENLKKLRTKYKYKS